MILGVALTLVLMDTYITRMTIPVLYNEYNNSLFIPNEIIEEIDLDLCVCVSVCVF
jgi:hypothetical protein